MQVKIFNNVGNSMILDQELNESLSNNKKIEIKDIKQSYAYDGEIMYALISIYYQ